MFWWALLRGLSYVLAMSLDSDRFLCQYKNSL
jgi:hypothetical protein